MRRVEGRVKGQKKEEKSQGKGERDGQGREERSVEKGGSHVFSHLTNNTKMECEAEWGPSGKLESARWEEILASIAREGERVARWREARAGRAASRKGSGERRSHAVVWHQALPGDIGKVGQIQSWLGDEWSARNKGREVRMLSERWTSARGVERGGFPRSTGTTKANSGQHGPMDLSPRMEMSSICKVRDGGCSSTGATAHLKCEQSD